ncbi:hypothetical protein ACVWWO_000292 [Bradyrhizobium sp. F1.13.1]
MGVLRAARERGVVGITDRILQVGADLVPALRELGFARPAEDAIGKLRRAKPGKADQLPLLLNSRGPLLGRDLGGEPDRRDIVAGALLPVPCEAARISKVEIVAALARAGRGGLRRRDRRPCGDRRRRRRIVIMIVGAAGIVAERGNAKAEVRRKGGVAEEAEGEWIVMRHLEMSFCWARAAVRRRELRRTAWALAGLTESRRQGRVRKCEAPACGRAARRSGREGQARQRPSPADGAAAPAAWPRSPPR